MKNPRFSGVLLPVLLVVALFSFTLSVGAEETEESTEIPETIYMETTVMETIPDQTVETIGTEPPQETEATEALPATEGPEIADAQPETVVIPISQLPEMTEGMTGVSFRGTVVLTRERELVVQDETGGVRVAWDESLKQSAGDIVLVTGTTGNPFSASDVKTEGNGPLPAVKTTLSQAPEALRIVLEDCTVRGQTLQQGEDTIALETTCTEQGEACVYGVILDGRFYADAIMPVVPTNPSQRNVYFGLLHGHSTISDGCEPVGALFSRAAGTQGLDFFAVTDHSDSFDNAGAGEITRDGSEVSADWAAGKQAAAQVTKDGFVGIFGYEMSWGEDKALGHINTFCTPGWQTRDQEGMNTLSGYFDALKKVPESVSQFNHPGNAYGEFRGFRDYDSDSDAMVQLLEIYGERGTEFFSQYVRALDAGWHVAPTAGGNSHDSDWGSARTGILAQELTEDALYQAIRSRRVYATQDSDLSIEYRLNNQRMGSVMGTAETLEAQVCLNDPTDADGGTTIEVLTTGGRVLLSQRQEEATGEISFRVPAGYPYYFLRLTQADGDVAVTAPVWVDDFSDMGIERFFAEPGSPMQGESVNLKLELFNKEAATLEVESVTLLMDNETVGTFHKEETGYVCPFLWQQPGEVRLTAVVRGTVDGKSRSYRENLTLHYRSEAVCKAEIAEARTGGVGTVYRIAGNATSGNTNAYTTFPDTIYVQDSTGGIPVVGEFLQQIQIGTPMDVTGVLREKNGERYLDLISWEQSGRTLRRNMPAVLRCKSAMDYDCWGGSLAQTEGTVKSLTKTPDRKGISRLTLQDSFGGTAVVMVEPEIGSGAYGVNHLASQIQVGETVRAIGLVSRDTDGKTVLRVRNCDEVVYVPPIPDVTNPKTSDVLFQGLLKGIGSLVRFPFPRKLG